MPQDQPPTLVTGAAESGQLYRKTKLTRAAQWFSDGHAKPWAQCAVREMGDHFEIDTREGTLRGEPGDWIAQGPAGEVYPIGAEIFADTYEPASPAPSPPQADQGGDPTRGAGDYSAPQADGLSSGDQAAARPDPMSFDPSRTAAPFDETAYLNGDPKITWDEVRVMFGDAMPSEALGLISDQPVYATIAETRAALSAIAERHRALGAAEAPYHVRMAVCATLDRSPHRKALSLNDCLAIADAVHAALNSDPTPVSDAPAPAGEDLAGQFASWTTDDLAKQCLMQAREMLDPELSRFFVAVAARLRPAPSAPSAGREAMVSKVRSVLIYRGLDADADEEDVAYIADAILALTATSPGDERGEMVRHVKSGGVYTILARGAQIQTDTPLTDYAKVDVYQHEETRAVWVRPVEEMHDGRFVPTPPAAATEATGER